MPTSLVAAGYEWTILDDAHFRQPRIAEEDLWGPYTTEDQGQLLRSSARSKGCATDPVPQVEEVIEYLRNHATDAVIGSG
jgi:hypothetical protein